MSAFTQHSFGLGFIALKLRSTKRQSKGKLRRQGMSSPQRGATKRRSANATDVSSKR